MVNFSVDKSKSTPLYIQIFNQFKKYIENGSIPPGYKLPTIRSLAKELGVNNVTVINAYRLLEANGYIDKKVGSGTYVSETVRQSDVSIEDIKALEHGQILVNKNMINFSSSSPNPELFPVDDFKVIINKVLERDGGYAFEYQDTKGYMPLRKVIAEFIKKDEVNIDFEDVQIISGGQQGIDVVSKALVNFGDCVLVESPTYSWAIASFKSRGAEIVDIELEKDGINIDALEEKLKIFKPKLIYTMPVFQNPTGISYSVEKMKRLIEIAYKYDTYIVEDDFSNELNFSNNKHLPLKAYDKYDRVIYIKSFSKIYMPGLRLGFILSPKNLINSFAEAKYVTDLSTSGLMQRAFEIYLREGMWEKHVERFKKIMRNRFDEMKRLLADNSYFEINIPDGGFYFWLKLKKNISAKLIYLKCIERNVSIVPGSIFFSNKIDDSHIRLSYASCEADKIRKGILTIEEVIKDIDEAGNSEYIPIV
ncbi:MULTISPECIES: PLP-dependent aminotransferase family protein [Thermoanaerobacterium]|uniref:Transcriptional regulator, GntR family with aminotransferase domain-containing protein n=2 Tax=Thermoanaerobacterium TaxID=28895 RepID=W9EB85_9THEO|nr:MULTISPECIES: PLP-dependent aminotransferase family protein [Thermoanaerobacterium]AFK86540.1 transcriptional regulator, GntR family with aminotransferase domain-containing protein [Thermoanaerobacterium saccharolyticum JW/SL-YS485]ETO38446.1 transcriptional regulator, GntR family with aminotransferase domain-containing protein [Thermoanaerobacterium aotearoense SCUT27]